MLSLLCLEPSPFFGDCDFAGDSGVHGHSLSDGAGEGHGTGRNMCAGEVTGEGPGEGHRAGGSQCENTGEGHCSGGSGTALAGNSSGDCGDFPPCSVAGAGAALVGSGVQGCILGLPLPHRERGLTGFILRPEDDPHRVERRPIYGASLEPRYRQPCGRCSFRFILTGDDSTVP